MREWLTQSTLFLALIQIMIRQLQVQSIRDFLLASFWMLTMSRYNGREDIRGIPADVWIFSGLSSGNSTFDVQAYFYPVGWKIHGRNLRELNTLPLRIVVNGSSAYYSEFSQSWYDIYSFVLWIYSISGTSFLLFRTLWTTALLRIQNGHASSWESPNSTLCPSLRDIYPVGITSYSPPHFCVIFELPKRHSELGWVYQSD